MKVYLSKIGSAHASMQLVCQWGQGQGQGLIVSVDYQVNALRHHVIKTHVPVVSLVLRLSRPSGLLVWN